MVIAQSIPLVVEFVKGSKIRQDEPAESPLPVLYSSPPGTYVTLPSGREIPIPTDQIVLEEQNESSLRIGLGGMSFEGVENEHLVFWRVRDLWPEEKLSPERSLKMTLHPESVKSIIWNGQRVWPKPKPRKGSGKQASSSL